MPGKPTGNQMSAAVRKTYKRKRRPARLPKRQYAAIQKLISKNFNKRAEKKHFLTYNTGYSVDYAGTIQSLSDITQGDTDVTRDGDSLYLRSIRVKGGVVVSDSTNAVRIIIFQWHADSTDDTATVNDILSATAVGTVVGPFASYYHDKRRLYTVMYDRVFNATTNESQLLFDTGYLRPKVRKISFVNASTQAVHKLFILAISDSAAAGHPTVKYWNRVTFNDM